MRISLVAISTLCISSLVACGSDGPNLPPGAQACADETAARRELLADMIATWSTADAAEMTATTGDQNLEADYAGKYRDDLATHPGCMARASYGANTSEPFVLDNEATVPAGSPATIAGFDCAAKEYDQPAEDTTKPIVILVHGNSSGATSFEEYANSGLAGSMISNVGGFSFTVEAAPVDSLATRLVDAGYRVIAFDARVDLGATLGDYDADATTGNPFLNIDHGWAVPMLQDLIRSVMTENSGRMVSLVGHSLGATVIRDTLRRLYNESKAGTAGAVNPFAQLKDVVLASGANHGVSSGSLCGAWPHMRGTVTCEMGDRAAFSPTYFTRPNNGPQDLYSTPCADGDFAFGDTDACDNNVVQYTTITMEDLPGGALQDEFVSEASSSLANGSCVSNELITVADFDQSGYFFTGAPGFFANHFGSVRSLAGVQLVLDKLSDE